MPVFEFAKEHYEAKGLNTSKLSYSAWIENNLKIKFAKGSDILKVEFKDSDKEFIIETLTLISNKYKTYSKKDRVRNLKNKISFLESQQKRLKDTAIKNQLKS